jgi:hypothetical protein
MKASAPMSALDETVSPPMTMHGTERRTATTPKMMTN